MGRKRVDQLRPNERREAVWETIRKMQRFTVHELHLETLLSKATIRDYVIGLTRAGYLKEDGKKDGEATKMPAVIYKLKRDIGIEAPRVKRDGTEVTQGRGREQLWRTIRILGEFTAKELAVTASTENHHVTFNEAKTYLLFLHKAGYVRCITPGKPGSQYTAGNLARYRSVRHTGPKPPQVQRIKQVYDPNLKKVVWPKGDADE